MSRTGRFCARWRWVIPLLALAACDGGTRGSGIGTGFATVSGSVAAQTAQTAGLAPAAAYAADANPAIVVQVHDDPSIQAVVDPVTQTFTLSGVPAGDVTLDFVSTTTASITLHGVPQNVDVRMVNVRFNGDQAIPAGFAVTPAEGDSADVVATPRKGAIEVHGLEVNFSIANATVPTPEQVVWSFGDGTKSGRTTTSHAYSTPGYYVVEAEIRGGTQSQRAFSVIEALAPGDQSLRVTANAEPDRGLPPLNVSFSATVENAVGQVTYTWDFDDDTALGDGQTVRHTFTQEGIFLVEVVAVDDGGNESRDVVQVEVNNGTRPVPLSVKASVDHATGVAPLQVKLSATITGSGPVSIEWDFDDGSLKSSDPNPVHTYVDPGLYFPTVTVVESDTGDSAVDQVSVEVTSP